MFIYIFLVLAVFTLPVSASLCRDKENRLVKYEPGFICCETVMPSVDSGMEVGCCGYATQLHPYYTSLCECKDDKIKPKTQDSSVDSCLVKNDRVPKKGDKQKSIPSLQLKERLTKSVCWKMFGLRYCEHAKTCFYPKKQICCEDGIHIGKKVCPSMQSNRKFGTANKDNKRNVSDEAYKHGYELLVKIMDKINASPIILNSVKELGFPRSVQKRTKKIDVH